MHTESLFDFRNSGSAIKLGARKGVVWDRSENEFGKKKNMQDEVKSLELWKQLIYESVNGAFI